MFLPSFEHISILFGIELRFSLKKKARFNELKHHSLEKREAIDKIFTFQRHK